MITLTATLNLSELNSLAGVLGDHSSSLAQVCNATHAAFEEARVESVRSGLQHDRDKADELYDEYDDAATALERWNALRETLGLR